MVDVFVMVTVIICGVAISGVLFHQVYHHCIVPCQHDDADSGYVGNIISYDNDNPYSLI